jgi:hypothetical protein
MDEARFVYVLMTAPGDRALQSDHARATVEGTGGTAAG